MGSYYTRQNFSLRPQYSIDLTITTSYVAGGTQVVIGNQAVKHTSVANAPNSAGSPRSYSTPNGRSGSVSGSLAESGSDSAWAFSFTTGAVPQYQNIWGASGSFTRFYPTGTSIGTISVTASQSLLGSSTASIGSIRHVFRTTFDFNGNGTSSYFVDNDSSDTIFLPNPTRTGFNFDGWVSGGVNYGTGTYTVNATRTLVASWSSAVPAPVFTSNLTDYTIRRVGNSVFDYFAASGTPTYTLSTSPTLSGLSIFNNSYVSGTLPAATTPATYTITVTATNDGGSATTSDSFTLLAAIPSWSDVSLGSGRVGQNYSNVANRTVTVENANSVVVEGLPTGLSYSTSTSGTTTTVTITGTPTTAGSWVANFYAYSKDYNASTYPNEFELTQISMSILPRIPVWVDSTITTLARKGVAYSDTISADFATVWDDGILPSSGISFSGTSNATGTAVGTISGTPTTYGTLSFVITPRNSASETPGGLTFNITIRDIALVWADQTLTTTTITEGDPYSDGVSVSGAPAVTYTVFSGSLPPGISLNSSTGALLGTPTSPGTYIFVIRATNGSNETLNTNTLTITVEPAGGFVRVKTLSGWQDATVYVKTAGGWTEATVNVKGASGWNPSFTQ